MFEARLPQGAVFGKVIEAIKDLVQDANLDCSSEGISLQAMDSSHVCLVSLMLRADGFDNFRCDRTLSMGIHLANLSKILKCADNDDSVSMKASNEDTLTLMFENQKRDRVSDFDLKLMEIESEHLGIPETEFSAVIKMQSAEYMRICKDLSSIGDTVIISATNDGIKFCTSGEAGTASITCRQSTGTDTTIELREPVTLTFALRYLNSFSKATPLSGSVSINLTKDLPVMVEYPVADMGHIRFYLAPKIDDEDTGDTDN